MLLLTARMEIDFNQEPAKQHGQAGWGAGPVMGAGSCVRQGQMHIVVRLRTSLPRAHHDT